MKKKKRKVGSVRGGGKDWPSRSSGVWTNVYKIELAGGILLFVSSNVQRGGGKGNI